MPIAPNREHDSDVNLFPAQVEVNIDFADLARFRLSDATLNSLSSWSFAIRSRAAMMTPWLSLAMGGIPAIYFSPVAFSREGQRVFS